ncbi:protein SHQ1 homolog isoform X2 [Ptychodera flava]|uniref:protein SHQ1 homolog isoform X2 n=1 Tax=Ptychodera flava TaxID=63121 RepID=UPI00396A63E7
MLTPAFELSQDAEYLSIIIKAKFAKVADTEIYVDGDEFKFYSTPYYLRLNLPGRILEDGRESASYDTDTGYFVLKFPKVNAGENFEGLDMLTKLLAPKGQVSAAPPLIEVMEQRPGDDASESVRGDEQSEEFEGEEEEEFDWQIDQQPHEELSDDLLKSNVKYGFANKRSCVFQELREELQGVVDVPDPDLTSPSERRKLRIEAENGKFDDDHYLADLYQDEMVQQILAYQPSWFEEYEKSRSQQSFVDGNLSANQSIVKFTEEEKEQLRKLPNKEYLLDKQTQNSLFFGLLDIIFAYAYNHRTTEGENTVESAWTICKLSSTLSWLQTFTSLQDVVVSCHRRSLCYPLYRHWKLTQKVYQDVQQIFSLGRRKLLQCLLEIHRLLSTDDTRYILNDLYVTDYCVWIQSAKKSWIASLAESLTQVKVSKSDLEFDLIELEHAAILVQEDGGVDEIVVGMENITVDHCEHSSLPPAEGADHHSQHGTEMSCGHQTTAMGSGIRLIEEINSLDKQEVSDDTSGKDSGTEDDITDSSSCSTDDECSDCSGHSDHTSSKSDDERDVSTETEQNLVDTSYHTDSMDHNTTTKSKSDSTTLESNSATQSNRIHGITNDVATESCVIEKT